LHANAAGKRILEHFMALAFLMLVQAAAPGQPPPPAEAAPEWRMRITPERSCASADPDEIVVCGRRDDDRYRIRELPSEFEAPPLRAETQLFDGVSGGMHVESTQLPNGMSSKRLMVSVKTRF
jgi:hypothetical protein